MNTAVDLDPMLYRVPEAARILAVSTSKMWEIVLRGDIESLKIDGARRITRDAIDAYVERLRPEHPIPS